MSMDVDLRGNNIIADSFTGSVGGVTAANVTVAAGTDGLSAGSVQAALQSLATRVKALESV